ncbi:MAG: hypothetical protein COA94_00805 [Rickettsiales bacterium]|nr:MAG: hypothetical protein COA94_00805 [Rickettsiales bacterium]
MSAQLIELVIFAAIAFFIINKLIAILGSTSDDDPTKRNSFFGENNSMKDVTDTGTASTGKERATILRPIFAKKKKIELGTLIVAENEKDIQAGLSELLEKLPAFNIKSFVKNVKSAFQMIIEASNEEDDSNLKELVDARYTEAFKAIASSYGEYSAKNELTAQISEIFMFGNNAFVKMLFSGKNITSKTSDMNEEWTFSKSTLNSSPVWQLTNIDRPQ